MADAGAEVCRDFKRNVCKKGDRCKFYHPAKDLSEIFTRNTVCHDFQNPKGCKRDTCKFLHMTKDEEDYIRTNGRAPPGMSEREVDRLMGLPPLCNDYMRGACNRGSDCKYRHVGEPGTAVGGRGGGGKMGGGRGGGDRFDPYSRDFGGPDMGRMEMKRRYREEMMEDEIMYLRAQVSRLKRQVADLAATNESLMDENARLRIDRGRTTVGGPSGGGPLLSTQPRMSELRSAYPYTPGLKMEAPNSSLGGIGGMNFSSGHPY